MLERMLIDAFVFEGAPQAFDEHIVHLAAATVHADADLGVLQHGGEGKAGELAALVGVKDVGAPEARQCFLQRHDAKTYIHRVRQPPSQHFTGRPVDDRHQVQGKRSLDPVARLSLTFSGMPMA